MHIELKHAVNVRDAHGVLRIVLRGARVNYSRRKIDDNHVEHKFVAPTPAGVWIEHVQTTVRGAVPSWL